jgi:type IV pilus assembly protein PilV
MRAFFGGTSASGDQTLGRQRNPPTAGFSVVELLVAVVVFSFGVLGVVGLHAAALRSHQEARHQTTGLQLARELAEMVRDNRAVGVRTVDNPYLGSFVAPAAGGIVPAVTSYCLVVSAACTDAQTLAIAHMTQWLEQVAQSLPGARVVTCFDDTPYNSSGLPQWECPADPSEGAPLVIKMGWRRLALAPSASGVPSVELATQAGGAPLVMLPFAP